MMGGHHAISGAAAWIAVTATVPFTLGLEPLPTTSVVLGSLVTAGAALLPDVDHTSATIAQSGGMFTKGISSAAGAASGGHRHGMHSILAVAGFTAGTIFLGRWWAVLPNLGNVPVGSALMLLALVACANKALKISPKGIARLWVSAAVVVLAVLKYAPHELTWLPTSVMVGVIVHLLGDMITTGGVPLLWPWVPKPPNFLDDVPILSRIWKPNGNLALPVLGNAGSKREWVLCIGLSGYTVYGIAATTGVLTA
ncbi:metal-dependent hydrolase [Pengzhenrongella sp.]|jgi:membrane-bound metal-dependent hydrolase YbcI (DUF457 family)|uniref:metal-dependent hydrolase n=1 Tax=Pengzhenrongella sp. TaxID=2888820 RepID=UPI002F92F442